MSQIPDPGQHPPILPPVTASPPRNTEHYRHRHVDLTRPTTMGCTLHCFRSFYASPFEAAAAPVRCRVTNRVSRGRTRRPPRHMGLPTMSTPSDRPGTAGYSARDGSLVAQGGEA